MPLQTLVAVQEHRLQRLIDFHRQQAWLLKQQAMRAREDPTADARCAAGDDNNAEDEAGYAGVRRADHGRPEEDDANPPPSS